MVRGSSKRSRSADKFSLRYKGQAVPSTDNAYLLNDDVRDKDMKDQVLLVQKKQKPAADSGQSSLKESRPVSKSEMRKLKQIERRKEAQARVQGALESLDAAKLNATAQQLMIPTSLRGGTMTAKQRLKRDKALYDAGLALADDSMLFKQRGSAPAVVQQKLASAGSVLSPSHSPISSNPVVEDSLNHSTAPSAVSVDVPDEELACRAPPISVTFGRRNKAAQPEEWVDSTPQHCETVDDQTRDPAAPMSTVLSEQQQQAVAQARKDLIDAGEMKIDDAGKEPPVHPPRSVPSLGTTRHRPLHRSKHIEETRAELPIIAMEQEIMAMTDEHDVVLLCGATGCGKTTQVPQFLLEAGFGCKNFAERSGMIGVTQPRRVAAVSTARRVAEEVGDTSQEAGLVGYQVRYDREVGSATAVKFMTDGILMRELQDDFLLTKYSVIIIDEAHERSLNTDLLIGMLSRIVPQRRSMHKAAASAGQSGHQITPLKFIIMSATMRLKDFVESQRLFPQHLYTSGPPPVISVPARQFPVVVHFSKRTETEDYVSAACRKTVRIHKELPPGGILVFVTGQAEVQQVVSQLNASLPSSLRATGAPHREKSSCKNKGLDFQQSEWDAIEAAGADRAEADATLGEDIDDKAEYADMDDGWPEMDETDDFTPDESDLDEDEEHTVQLGNSTMSPEDIEAAKKFFEEKYGLSASRQSSACKAQARACGTAAASGSEGAGSEDSMDSDAEDLHDGIGVRASGQEQQGQQGAPVHVLPLYAMLPAEEQSKVFEDPPAGHRLIIVSTNVAETSLTIPGIRYVVDAGRSKQKLLEESHVHRYQVRWISQASADQRAGRAGRTGPGHCYRLYSAAVFNDMFPKFTAPEIQNMQLDGVVLSMHALCLPKVMHFPFPTPPDSDALRSAEKSLVDISALTPKNPALSKQASTGADLKLTFLGESMVDYPLGPRHARLILAAAELLQQGRFRDKKLLVYAVALAATMTAESPFLASASATLASATDGPGGASDKKESEKLHNSLHAAHLKFRHRKSDALSALNAVIAFESQDASETGSFCKRHFLHATTLREISALRKQLMRNVSQPPRRRLQDSAKVNLNHFIYEAVSQCSHSMKPPGSTTSEALLRCIATGWADQVGKRVRSMSSLHTLANEGKGNRAIRYQNCSSDVELYMHPKSHLHKAAPDYVVYAGLTRTDKRTYMNTLSTADSVWLNEICAK